MLFEGVSSKKGKARVINEAIFDDMATWIGVLCLNSNIVAQSLLDIYLSSTH
jgi:hypothetical protein